MRIALLFLLLLGCKTPEPSTADEYRRMKARRETKLPDPDPVEMRAIESKMIVNAPAVQGGNPKMLEPFLLSNSRPKEGLSRLDEKAALKAMWDLTESYFSKPALTSSTSEGKGGEEGCYRDKILNGIWGFATYPSDYAYRMGYNIDTLSCAKNEAGAKRLALREQILLHRSCFGLNVAGLRTMSDVLRFKDECKDGAFQSQALYEDKSEVTRDGESHIVVQTKAVSRQDPKGNPCNSVKVAAKSSFTMPCLYTVGLLIEIDGQAVANHFSQLSLNTVAMPEGSDKKYPTEGVAVVMVNGWTGSLKFEATGSSPEYKLGDGMNNLEGILRAPSSP